MAKELSVQFDEADWQELKDKLPDVKTVRHWKGKKTELQTSDSEGQAAATQDVLVVDAKRKHRDAIVQLLESWNDSLLLDVKYLPHRINFDCDEETAPLFEAVLSHYPSIKQRYLAFCEERNKYQAGKNKLQQRVADEAPKEANKEFSKMVIWFAISRVDGNSRAYYQSDRNTGWLYMSHLRDFALAKGIARGNEEVRIRCRRSHKRLVRKYSKDEGVRKVVGQIRALRKLEKDLSKAVEESLLNKEYVAGCCKYCPRD
jgi:hypothetical protein